MASQNACLMVKRTKMATEYKKSVAHANVKKANGVVRMMVVQDAVKSTVIITN